MEGREKEEWEGKGRGLKGQVRERAMGVPPLTQIPGSASEGLQCGVKKTSAGPFLASHTPIFVT